MPRQGSDQYAPVGRIDDEPLEKTLEPWNAAHARPVGRWNWRSGVGRLGTLTRRVTARCRRAAMCSSGLGPIGRSRLQRRHEVSAPVRCEYGDEGEGSIHRVYPTTGEAWGTHHHLEYRGAHNQTHVDLTLNRVAYVAESSCACVAWQRLRSPAVHHIVHMHHVRW